jgi:hypothetical protein
VGPYTTNSSTPPLSVTGISTVGGVVMGTINNAQTPTPSPFAMQFAQLDAQAILEFDGAFTALSFTLQGTRNAESPLPVLPAYFNIDCYPYYQNTGTLVYPFTITSGPVAFFIPNCVLCDGLQVVVNSITGSANMRLVTGSFFNSLPASAAGGLTQNLWLELTRIRVALSDQNNTDYASAIAATDLGKV